MHILERYRSTPPGFKGLLVFLWMLGGISSLWCCYFIVTMPSAIGHASAIVQRRCGDNIPLTWIQRVELSESVRPRDLVKVSFVTASGRHEEITETFLSSSHVEVGDAVALRYDPRDPSFAFRADRLWRIPLSALAVVIAISAIPLVVGNASSRDAKG